MSYNIRTTLDVQDNLNIGKNANISGSLSVTGSINGNLNGTASFASTASYVLNAVSSSFATQAISSSFASTASFAPNYLLTSNTRSFATTGSNIFIGNQTITGSLTVSSSANTQLLIGTNTLFISSSNNVGIGTTNPGVRLDVIGEIRASTTMFNSTTQTNNIQLSSARLVFLSASVETARYDNNGWGFFNTAPTAKVHISGASADSLLRVGSPTQANALFVSGSGNVGIGTISPSAVVHVRGTTSGSNTTFRVENMNASGTLTVDDVGTLVTPGRIFFGGNTAGSTWNLNGSATIQASFGNESGQIELRPNGSSAGIVFSRNGNMGLGSPSFKFFSTPWTIFASGSVIVGDYSGFANNTAAPARFAVSGSNNQTLVNIGSPGSSSIFNISGSGVVTINGSIPVTRNATGYNVGRFTNSASFDNILVAISSSGNPVASSVSGSVNVYYNTISSVVGSAISSSVNTGAIFTTGSWSVLTSATLGSGGDTITSHIQDQDRGRLYRATFIQTAGPTSGSVVIERLI